VTTRAMLRPFIFCSSDALKFAMTARSHRSEPVSLGVAGIRGVRLAPPMAAFVYLLRCADGTLYCGWSTDPERRLRQHQAGTASRYTRTRRPVELVYTREFATRSEAMREEVRIKRLPAAGKRGLLT
jgi:putative endonuclease